MVSELPEIRTDLAGRANQCPIGEGREKIGGRQDTVAGAGRSVGEAELKYGIAGRAEVDDQWGIDRGGLRHGNALTQQRNEGGAPEPVVVAGDNSVGCGMVAPCCKAALSSIRGLP